MSFDAEWLRRVTNEAARTGAPTPDWDRIEHKLFTPVHHGECVTFTLDPDSRACIDSLDDRMDLQLLQGRVAVDVAPRGVPDSFTVRVGQTRVAVHGTVVSVKKRAERVLVRVDRGSVAVGPVGRTRGTMGWLLIAPASGSFSPDGAQAARFDTGMSTCR